VFRGVLAAAGVKCLRLPARSPDLNSVAERFVLSIKSECLSKLVPLGENHLRQAVSEYVVHYHRERNHRVAMARWLPSWQRAIVLVQHLAALLRQYQRYFKESRPHQGSGSVCQRTPRWPSMRPGR
jgi:hypothetical protein